MPHAFHIANRYAARPDVPDGNLSYSLFVPLVYEALADLPDNTVVDGEVVALNESGRPDFNLLQHYRAEASRIHYFVFDLLVYENRDLTQLSLVERRQIMKAVLKFESPRIRITDYFEASVEDMLSAARNQGLEGIVAKRKDSRYEIGKRSGSWAKYRLNSGQELVIGGYIPGTHGVDAIVVGYYRGEDLIYVARVRNGFVPASRRQIFARLKPLMISKCPFANLPEAYKGRWGEGLTAADMGKCVWVRPSSWRGSNSSNGPPRIIYGIQSSRGYERTRTHAQLLKNMMARVEDC